MIFKRLLFSSLAVLLLSLGAIYLVLWMSLPKLDGEVILNGLHDTVEVASDGLGIPTIRASNRDDVFMALGWIHARDRLFQMDLIRRKTAGRLAELFGPVALDWDKRQRAYGFERAARDIFAALPEGQKQTLYAYATGVNAFLAQAKVLPPEFLALRHSPETWRVEDSLLAGLGMFQTLDSQEEGERMLTVMKASLPEALTQFLSPDTGEYDAVLVGGQQSHRPARPIPVDDWVKLVNAKIGKPSQELGWAESEVNLKLLENPPYPPLVKGGESRNPPYPPLVKGGGPRNPPYPPLKKGGRGDLIIDEEPMSTLLAVDPLSSIIGSNQWVVGGAKTRDGRAILANDMHLSLSVPNIWYRASLHYGKRTMTGVTLPGLPLLVVGSNGHVAWGFTNVDADDLDLVRMEINPDNPDEYRTPEGWQAFDRHVELIHVKGEADQAVEIKNTVWGQVSPRTLMGQQVAMHWTALQATRVDAGLLDMDSAETLDQAMAVVNRSGGPTQNVVLADDHGHIGWTLTGRYPLRRGFDGSVSVSWAERGIGWDGTIPPDALPHLVDPPEGFIATANNRTLGKDYPFVIAHNQANGYRAHRIGQRLAEKEMLDEQDMLSIQLDTRSEFFEYYRKLALEMIGKDEPQASELDEARRYINAWNGHMDADSLGIGLLWQWREKLAAIVFAPVVAHCRQADAGFSYSWRQMETPLRALLNQRIPLTLPNGQYRDWRDLIRQSLAESVRELKRQHGIKTLTGLTWGAVNRVPVRHPFSKSMPFLSPLLDMANAGLSGCAGFCVRIVGNGHGASERMVISPGHQEQGILHMPGGQSGHPLSTHYRDQHPAWQEGVALPFQPGESRHKLLLLPTH